MPTSPSNPPLQSHPGSGPPIRVGHGFDLHRLDRLRPSGQGNPLILAGVRLPPHSPDSEVGPVAHSDGDVLLHAVTDALLGALALPDIGQQFPDSDPAHKSRNSAEFLALALGQVRAAGWVVGNLDATVILERPKIGPHKGSIRANLARLLGVPIDHVNVKGKTHEAVDAVGQGLAIEAHAVVLLLRVGP